MAVKNTFDLILLLRKVKTSYAPLSSSRGGVPSFLSSDDHNVPLETSNQRRNMYSRSQSHGDARTSQQLSCSFQSFNSSTGIAQQNPNYQQASQLTDEEYLDFLKQTFGITTTVELNNLLDLIASQTYSAWDTFNQRATSKTIAPAVLDARYPHAGFEVAPAGVNQPLHYPQTGQTTPTTTGNELPITAGNTKRRKVNASFDAGTSQTSTANFMASQQKPSYSTVPTPTASHSFNRTQHEPSYSPGSMPTADSDFTGAQQEPIRRKARMQKTGPNFTASQQRPSSSMHPAANTPSPSSEQVFNHGSPAYSVSPPFQYQQPAVNNNAHQDVCSAPPSGQQASASMPTAQPTSFALTPFNKHAKRPSSSPSAGQFFSYSDPAVAVSPRSQYQQPAGSHNTHQNVWSAPSSSQYGAGFPSASMSPAQPTSRALMPFNQYDNVPSPSTSPEQDFTLSYSSSASSPPFNIQQPGEYDTFHQDFWSSPPSGAELPTSSFTTTDLTPPNFSQDNQQGNYLSSGPQINVYQRNNVNQLNNVSSNGPQVNQQGVGSSPANTPSTQPASFVPLQTNQQGNILSSGPQANQQGAGIPPANMPPAQPASVAPPQVNQQGNALSSGPHVNQQSVGIASASMPPAQAAPVAPPQANQQGNAPSNGPQANQQNNVAANGQQVNLHRNVVQTIAGINRIDGHNADMKALRAIPPGAKLPAMELSLTELLTYFPNHTTWPYVMLRFRAAGAPTKRVTIGRVFMAFGIGCVFWVIQSPVFAARGIEQLLK
ncbi:hypothetical protein KC331_g3439 [Hortaea werneckii]|nr:hypothetical protein KC331_g3439 [Hortaea werneckii]KAI7719010.1 hypothetical protein KC353_g3328 [Hortaea werneckii]